MKQNIDDLHAVVSEARLRKKTGEVRQDVWKEDLHPREATRSRTIPVLTQARDHLMAELQQVSSQILVSRSDLCFDSWKMKTNNCKSR